MESKQKIQETWNRMNQSEKHGVKFGLFPSWIDQYKLTKEDHVELMKMAG